MSRTGDDSPAWMRPADQSILRFLRSGEMEYPAIIANRTGVHTPYVEKRCEVLAERGLVERVSGEVVYRITGDGRSHV